MFTCRFVVHLYIIDPFHCEETSSNNNQLLSVLYVRIRIEKSGVIKTVKFCRLPQFPAFKRHKMQALQLFLLLSIAIVALGLHGEIISCSG